MCKTTTQKSKAQYWEKTREAQQMKVYYTLLKDPLL